MRLKMISKLTYTHHVSRKNDEYGRRVTTSWFTGVTEVCLERCHSNKKRVDVDDVIYIGRSIQHYVDKFDKEFGYRLAAERAFAKFFSVGCKCVDDASKLAERTMDCIAASGADHVVINDDCVFPYVQKNADSPVVKSKRRGRPRKQPV